MSGNTNKIKVELLGKDRSFGKTLHKAGAEGRTFGGIMKGIGKVLLFLAKVAIAAVVAALVGMIAFVLSAKKAYEGWMTNLSKTIRLTGMSAKSASELAVQMKMSGVEATKAQAGLGLFAKALDGARRGLVANVEPFKRLHIALKDSRGNFLSIDEVLPKVRDKLSRIKDAATRAGIAAKLFGRGFKEMLPWLMKSSKEIAGYVKLTERLGLVMTKQSMKAFGDYRQNQRKVSLAWEAIKINAYSALVPVINLVAGPLIGAMQRAAHWMGQFRRLVEKKGLKVAVEEMVPGIKDAEKWWRRNEKDIRAIIKGLGSALKWMVKWMPILSRIQSWFNKWLNPLGAAVRFAKALWSALVRIASAAQDVFAKVKAVGSALNGWSSGAINAVRSAVLGLVSWLNSAYNLIVRIKSALAGGGLTPSGGQIGAGTGRHRAFGGIVTRPEVALIGEAGPEAVIPLNKPARAAQVMEQAGLTSGGHSPAGDTYVFEGCLFAQDFDTVIAAANARGTAKSSRRNLRLRPA